MRTEICCTHQQEPEWQEGEGSALGAAGHVAVGHVASASMARAWGQRQERPQNILGICTLWLYITNMQIISPHDEWFDCRPLLLQWQFLHHFSAVWSRVTCCDTVFLQLRYRSSSKQTLKNILVKRNLSFNSRKKNTLELEGRRNYL